MKKSFILLILLLISVNTFASELKSCGLRETHGDTIGLYLGEYASHIE